MRARRDQATRRVRRDRGATLVEYALGTALILVVGLGTFNWLSDEAGDEASAQADCISTRPPPPTCVRTPVPAPTSTSPTSSSTTTTLSPTPTDPEPTTTTTTPPASAVTGGTATVAVSSTPASWKVTAPVTVKDLDDAPVEGAVVTARFLVGRQPIVVECTTDASGTCDLVVDPIPDDLTATRIEVVQVESEPPANGEDYPFWDVTKP